MSDTDRRHSEAEAASLAQTVVSMMLAFSRRLPFLARRSRKWRVTQSRSTDVIY